MFAVGIANPTPIDYNDQKCSIVGDTELLLWFYIGFMWKNIIYCSSQAVVSQYVSFGHNDSIKHSQALHPLNCASTSSHEGDSLAETVNQCKAKIPQKKQKIMIFKSGKLSELVGSASLQTVASPQLCLEVVWGHKPAAGTGMYTGNLMIWCVY